MLDSPVSLLPILNLFVPVEKVLEVAWRSKGELVDVSRLCLVSSDAFWLEVIVIAEERKARSTHQAKISLGHRWRRKFCDHYRVEGTVFSMNHMCSQRRNLILVSDGKMRLGWTRLVRLNLGLHAQSHLPMFSNLAHEESLRVYAII